MPADGYRLVDYALPACGDRRRRSAAGAFYAVQTLRQLLPAAAYGAADVRAVELPVVTIEDKPCLGYRGMMLDVGRHFFTVDEVKEALDIMALHKLNVFHWHLTDDQGWRIEIRKYPKLTEVGSGRSRTLIGRDPGGDVRRELQVRRNALRRLLYAGRDPRRGGLRREAFHHGDSRDRISRACRRARWPPIRGWAARASSTRCARRGTLMTGCSASARRRRSNSSRACSKRCSSRFPRNTSISAATSARR